MEHPSIPKKVTSVSSEVTIEKRDHIAQITLDRPPVNALTPDTMAALIDAFDDAGATPDIRVAVFCARGRVFCAGSDIKARRDSDPSAGAEAAYNRLAREINTSIADCAVPVITAVDGPALGGGLCLVAASDVVVVSPRATFGLPEINVGLLGGAAWATRLFGARWARRMMLTGDQFTAEELLHSGTLAAAYLVDDPLQTAMSVAAAIASKSPAAIRMAKASLNDIEFMDLREGYRHEQSFTARLRHHPDSREAMTAFAERRKPRFDD